MKSQINVTEQVYNFIKKELLESKTGVCVFNTNEIKKHFQNNKNINFVVHSITVNGAFYKLANDFFYQIINVPNVKNDKKRSEYLATFKNPNNIFINKIKKFPYYIFHLTKNGSRKDVQDGIFEVKFYISSPFDYLSNEEYNGENDKKEKEVKSLDTTELIRCALDNTKPKKPIKARQVLIQEYKRNYKIRELLLRIKKSEALNVATCDLCNKEAPFIKNDNMPYLEVHHVIPLSENGTDTFDNIVALCPNCHRRIHILKDKKDVDYLKKIAQNRFKKIKNTNKK